MSTTRSQRTAEDFEVVDLSLKQYKALVEKLSVMYADHPDTQVYSADFRTVLARCMANKLIYGETYDETIESILKRIKNHHDE